MNVLLRCMKNQSRSPNTLVVITDALCVKEAAEKGVERVNPPNSLLCVKIF